MKIALLLLIFTCHLQARGFKHFIRSPKALMMGDAYTAIANDAYTMFYNPALLGRASILEFYPAPIDGSVVNFLGEEDRVKDLGDDSTNPSKIAERFLGFPIHAHAGITPGIKIGGFSLSGFVSSTTDFSVRNAIHPVLDLDYRLDRGWAFGYGHVFGKGKATTAFGFTLKRINRLGLADSFGVFSKKVLDIVNSGVDDYRTLRRELGYSEGEAWGLDVGMHSQVSMAGSTLSFGLSINDVGGTDFKTIEGDQRLPDQDMSINVGVAYELDLTLADLQIAFDISPINETIPFDQKMHLGAKLGIPLIDVMAGFGGGHFSYGVGVDLFPLEIIVGRYGVEFGDETGDLESDRFVIYASLLDFQFDL